MAQISLSASTRTQTGKHAASLRRAGTVPAILYGYKLEPLALSTDERQLHKVWHRAGKTHFIDLVVDDRKPQRVLIRDFQIDPRSARPLHADFLAVNMSQKMTADVPLVVVGEAPAVSELKLGQLLQTLTTVKVECLPNDLPAQISVDVSELMEVEAHILLKDLEFPAGVTLVTDPEEMVVKVAPLRVQAVEEEVAVAEEGEAAPAAEGEATGDEGSTS